MCFVISGCVLSVSTIHDYHANSTCLACTLYYIYGYMYSVCNHITLMWYIFLSKITFGVRMLQVLCNTWCLQLVFSNCLPLEGGIGFCSCILSYHWWSLVPGPNMAAICSCPLPQMVPQDSLVKSHADVMHVVLWMIFISYLIQGRNCTNICSS